MENAGQTPNVESICCAPGRFALLPLTQDPAQKAHRRDKERLE